MTHSNYLRADKRDAKVKRPQPRPDVMTRFADSVLDKTVKQHADAARQFLDSQKGRP